MCSCGEPTGAVYVQHREPTPRGSVYDHVGKGHKVTIKKVANDSAKKPTARQRGLLERAGVFLDPTKLPGAEEEKNERRHKVQRK
jgi:hypothetical protein